MPHGPALSRLVEGFYLREWDRRPSEGSRIGRAEYDDRLETPTAELVASELADVRATRAELNKLPTPSPGTVEWLDRHSIAAHLDMTNLRLAEIEHWRTNPVEPVETAIGAIFGLLMRRDVTLPETAEAVRRRLLAIPNYLGAVTRSVDRPVRMWVVAARPAATGAVEFLRDAVPELAQRHPARRSALESAAAAAIEALGLYDDWLQSLLAEPLSDDPAVGQAALDEIVRDEHGLPYTLDEIDAIGQREVARISCELNELARSIDPRRSWQQIHEDARIAFAAQPHDLLREYREATYGLRDRLVADGVIELPPGETCDVISTPAFLRSVIPSAAYSSPGPLDAVQRGIYYVSDPPPSLPPAEFRDNLGQHFGFESTCAHEAYPGHHVQLCWANRAGSLARQMAHHIIFMEGWTLYCEQLIVDLGYLATPMWQLDCLLSQLWRAWRIRIDVAVHTRRITVREAVDILKRELGFTELRAQCELNWYTQSPGTPISYLLGRHETLALRDRYRSLRPSASLRDFHNWLLRFGSVPQRWLLPFVESH
jgi:uncharacterized protein (DUF885 family)